MQRLLPSILFTALLAGLFLAAGCTVQIGDGGMGGTEAGMFQPGIPYSARASRIIDGDTLRITLPDGSEETVRILGIDTPEVTPGGNNPDTFEGVSDPWFLSAWGEEASSTLRREMEGMVVAITIDQAAGERDRYGRLLAYVHTHNGTDIGELLLSLGMARVYTAESFARKDLYLEVQERAMRQRTGLWSGMPPALPGSERVLITAVHFDAAGDDRINLNDEYITLQNNGSIPVTLTGWQVRDSDGFVYTFPVTALDPGAALILHTGSGILSSTHLYLNSTIPVLNNDADTVTLLDTGGAEVSRFSWG
jgi:micrococcal nuclease